MGLYSLKPLKKHYKIDINLHNTVYYGNIIIFILQTTKPD